MRKADCFFFYGTLARPGINRVSRSIHRYLEPIGPARIGGALYAICQPQGWYPALVAGEGQVFGHLFAAAPGFEQAQLSHLDSYEDFDPRDPGGSLYVRELRCVDGESGPQKAFVYHYNQPLPNGAERITGGDFLAWLAKDGLRAFGGLSDG